MMKRQYQPFHQASRWSHIGERSIHIQIQSQLYEIILREN